MKMKSFNSKLNNAGSAIVTVLVIIAFITILATTILYLAFSNYKMKLTERKAEEQFYLTETTLEEIRANLALLVSQSVEEAYIEILPIYASTDADTRESIFITNMANRIEKNWEHETDYLPTDTSDERRSKIQTYINRLYNPKVGLTVTFTGSFDKSHAADGYFLLTGLVIEYSPDKYYSKVTTDIIINYPSIAFPLENTTSVTDPATHARNNVEYVDFVQYMNWKKE